MSDDFVYHIACIAEDAHDLYVSDDGGYTWEYYGTYESNDIADEEGEAAVEFAVNRKDYTL